MPAYEKVDGVWREVWGAYVKVDGVWRDIDMSTKAEDQWRVTHINDIHESDISGFRMVYTLNPNKQHPLFPTLKTNLNMPVTFSLTGENIGMNELPKGALYQYERFGDEQGVLMYEGRLYAVLNNGCIVDVASSKNTRVNNDDERKAGPIPSMPEVWITSRMRSLGIELEGQIMFEAFRFHLYGWNSLFTKDDFLLPDPYTSDVPYRDIKRIESLSIIPAENRPESFNHVASIGIARQLKTLDNMIGAYGIMDHTIKSIKVNGTTKPFIIEIYN